MSYISNKKFLLEVEKGNVAGHSLVHKFGRNKDVGTTYEPLTTNGIYRTPQVSGAATLRVAAGNVNDSASGSGAREITIEGLDETGAETTEAIATNGTSAGTASTTTWLRVYRAYVSASGTYATASAGSHAADIVLETTGGTEWVRIDSSNFPKGQSQIGVFTIPLGKTGYLMRYSVTTDSNKAVDFVLFRRQSILETAAPYSAMRVLQQEVGIQGDFAQQIEGGVNLPALTDVGFMVKSATSADVSVDFELLLVDD